ncbi:MAG TPA: hypothetical protein VKU40_17135 [Thermoanaerobaculia bacterium]|nr:hypothetical protein [Thermoanaerobaculia bacterium]
MLREETATAGGEETWRSRVTVHALAWLTVTCAVGLLMATLLLVPRANGMLAPWTYGRWASLHLDLALYGWLALPLLGLLLHHYRPEVAAGGGRWASLAIEIWSAALLVGAVSWLAGGTSGKLFLDWHGPARWAFVSALAAVAVLLAILTLRGAATARRTAEPAHRWWLPRAALLAVLAAVPWALAAASDPAAYPPVDPTTGGPTGASLLGSSLAVAWIFLGAPYLLRLERKPAATNRRAAWLTVLLVLHSLAYAVLAHGDHSHHEVLQIAALVSLAPYAWWLPRHLLSFTWPLPARRWMGALLAWGGLLLATALVTFLPGVLDRVKFTNVLVAHSHLAMAAFATAFAALLLIAVDAGAGRVLAAPWPFATWQGGTLLHVVALTAAGGLEAADPSVAFRPSVALTSLYAGRWLAGAAMTAAALAWLHGALRGSAA